MELKKYQKHVIADLTNYLSFLAETNSLAEAYAQHWAAKSISVGMAGMPAYQNIIDQVPNVCYKVPTGGGKTLLACASLKPIFNTFSPAKPKVVVWLVPSDSILTQTLAALKDPAHPYRQRLNLEFGSRVEVYSKEELLAGQNFSPAVVADQLSVMVLSYDSFRRKTKDGLRVYRENGALASFTMAYGAPEHPIDDADESALFQIVNQLEPVVVVDESHHARTELSLDMLRNFNPSFVLDLTATPKKESNIISYVDALALKSENMVKLPVVVYNRSSQSEVVANAIDVRNALERLAVEERSNGEEYIRPIVLFQAQPKIDEDAATFEKVREKLIQVGIPQEQIAIKTSEINELKNIDLLSEACPIRYIITVNALKEGWDCSFAYVLASLANKTSEVDVEQILGRILRQPHARKHSSKLLNTSFVLTSSNNFNNTVDNIVKGLHAAGFTRKDYRAATESIQEEAADTPAYDALPWSATDEVSQGPTSSTPEADTAAQEESQDQSPNTSDEDVASQDDDGVNFDPHEVSKNLGGTDGAHETGNASTQTVDQGNESTSGSSRNGSTVEDLLDSAENQSDEYEKQAEEHDISDNGSTLPVSLADEVPIYRMNSAFMASAQALRLPQFYMTQPDSIFDDLDDFESGTKALVRPEGLSTGFKLLGQETSIDLSYAAEQMTRIDVSKDDRDIPKQQGMTGAVQQRYRQHWESLSSPERVSQCTQIVTDLLEKKFNAVQSSHLKLYVKQVVENLDSGQLATLESSPRMVAGKIESKIKQFLADYRATQFDHGLDVGSISAEPEYALPKEITLAHPFATVAKSLYTAEEVVGNEERNLLNQIVGMNNLSWWHRVPSRATWAFFINGAINHYPDFMLATASGKIVLVEFKGEQLKNEDSRRKIKLGQLWATHSGPGFRYYMVFKDGVEPLEGGLTVSKFLERFRNL